MPLTSETLRKLKKGDCVKLNSGHLAYDRLKGHYAIVTSIEPNCVNWDWTSGDKNCFLDYSFKAPEKFSFICKFCRREDCPSLRSLE